MGRKTKHINLSEKEVKELELGYKKGKQNTYRQRCHYILLSHEKYKIQEIAKIYKKTRQRIGYWLKRYEEGGIKGLETAKGRGRPPIIRIDNETEVKKVEKLVEENGQNLKKVLAEIEKELGKKMSKDTLKRLLKKKVGFGSDIEK